MDNEGEGTDVNKGGNQNGDPGQLNKDTQTPGGEQNQQQQGQQPNADPNANGDAANPSPFKDLQLDADTRTWLEKRGVKGVDDLAKTAHEQSKLLGNAIRVPGKDATPEEREAFLNKLGRPEKVDGYEFKPPENLPETLPYDGERAASFKGLAHQIGLTQTQAAAIHDWAVTNTVEDFNSTTKVQTERNAEIAKGETAKLEKLWGPLDSDTMKANLAYADKAIKVGGEDVLNEFKRVGLIGDTGGVILSAPIAQMMAKFGQALFKEDDVLRGNPARLNNPFEEGPHFNVTAQMKMIKEDHAGAMGLIASLGKKPSDFGLKE